MMSIGAVSAFEGIRVQMPVDEPDPTDTLKDPRSQTSSPGIPNGVRSPQHNPNLDSEIAALSTKLIDAMNHQTMLDDSLNSTRHDLETAKKRIAQLEAAAREHESALSSGILLRKVDIEDEQKAIEAKAAEEVEKRIAAEKEKKRMEAELEGLTSQLFEEANQMVANAQRDREAAEKRTEQVKAQLADAETLLKTHQEQLSELKMVLQQISSDKEESVLAAAIPSAPASPSLETRDSKESTKRPIEPLRLSSMTNAGDLQPSNPLSFPYLIQPVLRTDQPIFDDFMTLFNVPRSKLTRINRSASNVNMPVAPSTPPHNITTPASALAAAFAQNATSSSLPSSPTTAGSPVNFGAPSGQSIRDTRFYKKILTEDIEPTLRLDVAPHISWMARRSVLTAIVDGSVFIDPSPSLARARHTPCAMCGETRREDQYSRTHSFRISEAAGAASWLLCEPCLGRLRTTCDFLNFLRLLKDGLWQRSEVKPRAAWEECIRLRERMFWARVGGGVLPAFAAAKDSPRTSEHDDSESEKEEEPATAPIIEDAVQPAPTVEEVKTEAASVQEAAKIETEPITAAPITAAPITAVTDSTVAEIEAEPTTEAEKPEPEDPPAAEAVLPKDEPAPDASK